MSDFPKAPPLPRRTTPPGPPPRRPSHPGQYAYTPDADETPTRPDGQGLDPTLAVLLSVHRQEPEIDRKRLARMVEAWHSLPIDRRILAEHLIYELAKPR